MFLLGIENVVTASVCGVTVMPHKHADPFMMRLQQAICIPDGLTRPQNTLAVYQAFRLLKETLLEDLVGLSCSRNLSAQDFEVGPCRMDIPVSWPTPFPHKPCR